MWRFVVVGGLLGCHPHRSQHRSVPDASCAEGTRLLVFGAVNKPGPIVCRPGMHLGDALAAAGGLTPLARRSHIRLRRGTRTYIVRYDSLRTGDTPEPMLGADDEIFVGERDARRSCDPVADTDARSARCSLTPRAYARYDDGMLPLILLAPLVVGNSSLSLPLPKGYKDVSAEAVKKMPALAKTGALALVKDGAVSINVVPSEHRPEADLSDVKECALFAEEMQERLHGQSPRSMIVDGPSGKTCQIAISYSKPRVTIISTILRGPTSTWMLTCTMAPTDGAATQVCQDTIKAITFKP